MVDRSAISEDFERVRADFHRLLDAVTDDEWNGPTFGTRWTNEQLLFHMVFGYMIVQKLLFLVRFFGRLPPWMSRGYARILNAATPIFHQVNFYGSNGAARVYDRRRMGRKLDRVLDSLQRTLAREDEEAFARGMYFPVRWDPYFQEYMTLEQVYRYPGQHYSHHRRQLNLVNLPG